MMRVTEIKELKGKTFSKVYQEGNDAIYFETEDGYVVKMHHEQSCCERVVIEDMCGYLEDLVGTPILVAEERSCTNQDPEGQALQSQFPHEWVDCYTWTFYEIKTIKGSVTIRWYGESNGYYSERVDFTEYYLNSKVI